MSTSFTQEILQAAYLRAKYSPKKDMQPLPHQIPPDELDSSLEWETWLLMGGRGAGKTFAGANYVMKHLREMGPLARVGVMAPTNKDARSVCAEGRSGIMTLFRDEFTDYHRTSGEAWHRDGGFVQFKGAENLESWRGPSWSMLWIDEWAVCNEEGIENAMFGLRDGEDPKLVATTTPRPIQRLRELVADPLTYVSRATSHDNPHISSRAVERMERRYGGTRLGRQEIHAEILDDVEGALWNHAMLDKNRVDAAMIDYTAMGRIVVAIDPAVSANQNSDFTAICVAGEMMREYYVFELEDMKVRPSQWARKALELYMQYEADAIVGERNNGGDMVESVIRYEAAQMEREGLFSGVQPNVSTVYATRGKNTRAEPVAALDEQGQIHHVGSFKRAEDQMCAYPVEIENDDLIDARVWAIYELDGIQPVPNVIPIGFSSGKSKWLKAG